MPVARRGAPRRPPDAEAELEGVRSLRAGLLREHHFGDPTPGGLPCSFDGHHFFFDREVLRPGESTKSFVWFLHPELVGSRVREGARFSVREGPHLLASGTIRRVLRPA